MSRIRRIYFDTNILRGLWPGRIRPDLQVLARLARLASVSLCIPETVVVEHKCSVIRHAMHHLQKAEKEIREANKLLSMSLPLELPPRLELAAKEAEHDQAVEDAVWSLGFEVVPATTKSVLDFVRFAAQLDPPFKAEDRGFRDAAHFYTILEHLREEPLESDEDGAIFLCTDKPFAASVAVIAANEKVRCVHEIQEAIELLKPLLATVDADVLRARNKTPNRHSSWGCHRTDY